MENVKLNNISVLEKRWNKFKTLKRGYYSLLVLTSLYKLHFLPFLINNRALVVKYDGEYFPVLLDIYLVNSLIECSREARYRILKESFKIDVNDEKLVLMPLYPFTI